MPSSNGFLQLLAMNVLMSVLSNLTYIQNLHVDLFSVNLSILLLNDYVVLLPPIPGLWADDACM